VYLKVSIEIFCIIFVNFYGFSARWIGNHGFSIGIDDVQPGKLLNEQKRQRILEGYAECDRLIQLYNEGKLPLMPGCDAAQTLEAKITEKLNEIREIAGKVVWLHRDH